MMFKHILSIDPIHEQPSNRRSPGQPLPHKGIVLARVSTGHGWGTYLLGFPFEVTRIEAWEFIEACDYFGHNPIAYECELHPLAWDATTEPNRFWEFAHRTTQ